MILIVNWCHFNCFISVGFSTQQGSSKNGSSRSLLMPSQYKDVHTNPDSGCYVLQVTTLNYIFTPVVMGMTLTLVSTITVFFCWHYVIGGDLKAFLKYYEWNYVVPKWKKKRYDCIASQWCLMVLLNDTIWFLEKGLECYETRPEINEELNCINTRASLNNKSLEIPCELQFEAMINKKQVS